MGKLSAFDWSRVVSLECVPEYVDAEQVRLLLGRYGKIKDIQFWRSHNEHKHGFVTFEHPTATRLCLDHARDLASVLSVRPVNDTRAVRYKNPQGSPESHAKSTGPAHEQTPQLLSRMSLSLPGTPSHQPQLQLKEDSIHPPAAVASTLPPRPPSSTSRREPRLSLNGIHESPQQSTHPVKNSLHSVDRPIGARPSISEPSRVALPAKPSATLGQARDTPLFLESENKKNEAEILRLKDEIRDLQSTMRTIRDNRASALEAATAKASHYKGERDRCHFDLEAAAESTRYYKAQCEDLKGELARERTTGQATEYRLKHELRARSSEVSKLKGELEAQNREISTRAFELSQCQQKLRAMENSSRKTRFSAPEGQRKGDKSQEVDQPEPEEGQLNVPRAAGSTSNSPSKPSSPAPTHRQLVFPALEKAFLYLDELTNAALLKVEPVDARDSNGPNKRQKRLDDA